MSALTSQWIYFFFYCFIFIFVFLSVDGRYKGRDWKNFTYRYIHVLLLFIYLLVVVVVYFFGRYTIAGLDRWTGPVDWNGGLAEIVLRQLDTVFQLTHTKARRCALIIKSTCREPHFANVWCFYLRRRNGLRWR